MAAKMKVTKASTNGASRAEKTPRRTGKGSGKAKEMTAREATLRAWQKTYENREKRLG
ncbi:MAG: hypothetical protein HY231_01425 [Acidobacteria bacterium]|nr:hypothetical protein [Acidobacteriota bacterium]